MKWAISFFTRSTGVRAIGPFDTREQAEQWAADNHAPSGWSPYPLSDPADPETLALFPPPPPEA